jgi:hypothetical protein
MDEDIPLALTLDDDINEDITLTVTLEEVDMDKIITEIFKKKEAASVAILGSRHCGKSSLSSLIILRANSYLHSKLFFKKEIRIFDSWLPPLEHRSGVYNIVSTGNMVNFAEFNIIIVPVSRDHWRFHNNILPELLKYFADHSAETQVDMIIRISSIFNELYSKNRNDFSWIAIHIGKDQNCIQLFYFDALKPLNALMQTKVSGHRPDQHRTQPIRDTQTEMFEMY